MKLLIINSSYRTGSTGRIIEGIYQQSNLTGDECKIAHGMYYHGANEETIKIGNKLDKIIHVLATRFFDAHGFGSVKATKKLIEEIKEYNPDIINLHNIHGYYINIELLFTFLKEYSVPVIWTLHDCWSFTGHCSYFDRFNCGKWQEHCHHCPNTKGYPKSWLIDNSEKNFWRKRDLFLSLTSLSFVAPSMWMSDLIKRSFFKEKDIQIINNGVDINIFKPVNAINIKKRYLLERKKIILGVANMWDSRKGLSDFLNLSQLLDEEYIIILVGLSPKQKRLLPSNIIGISRTENVHQLAELYSAADVFINPTYIDNFPTTNIEALACGTPVITYCTGGSPEAIDDLSGKVIQKGAIIELKNAVEEILTKEKAVYQDYCRSRAEKLYNKDDRYSDYMNLFKKQIEG